MALMQWHIVSRDQYNSGTPVDSDLYFITGENVIYRGTELFTKAMEFYTGTLPIAPAPNRIYVNSTTLEGSVWNGSSWTTVIKSIADTVTPEGTNPVSAKAVATYVAAEIAKITGSGNVLTEASWDPTEHILTFEKGDSSNTNITLSGLGVSLNFNSETGVLNLLDASGEILGSGVNLGLEKFVKSGEYNDERKVIILYFNDEKTDKVEIPVGDLVDTYTTENSETLNLEVIANVISGSVNISTEEGNALIKKADGLFVPTTNTSSKMDKDTDATSGNIAIFDENGNAVDSGKSFDDISANNNIYVGDSIENAVSGNTPVKNDYCIVKTQIGSTGKYQHTAYVYNGSNWEAMDGNYSAENVYWPEDLVTTSAVGNITLNNGQATIPAAGKSLKDVWNSIFVKEKNPTVTQPSVSISAPQNKAYEVGTTVTPTYTASLNAGSYEFGPATGVTAESWEITDTDSHSASTNSGSFDAFVVGDDTNYKITAKANYGAGVVPKTNIGNNAPDFAITAGSKTATSAAVTGYRNGFYGTLTTKNGAIDSDLVRSLSKKTGKTPVAGNTWDVPIPVGALRVVFAYPATIRDVNFVADVNGMGADVKTAFTLHQIDVEGANNYTAIAYKVYVMDLANPNDVANTYKVTL